MLIKNLLSRIEMKEYYPSRHAKKEKAKPRYLFISVQYFDRTDPITGVVTQHRIGFTYRKS